MTIRGVLGDLYSNQKVDLGSSIDHVGLSLSTIAYGYPVIRRNLEEPRQSLTR